MEELFKTHVDEPYGWVLWIQEALEARAARRKAREAAAPTQPVDTGLHQLSAPH